MIHILVADDYPLLRRGIQQVLQQEPDFGPLAEAETAEDALRRIDEKTWDAVLLGVMTSGKSGLEVLREIRKRKPGIPVLMLSTRSEEVFAVRAIKAGANGYLPRNIAPAELVRAIRRVLAGKRYVSLELAEALANAVEDGAERPAHELLSDREYDVFCRIAGGKSVSEIAQETSLSVKTISTYRARALEKMHMRTNAELTRYAIRLGLVD